MRTAPFDLAPGQVNDVSLAAMTGGFRQLLLSRGEIPTPHTLRSLVPVSTRKPGRSRYPTTACP
ncbi:MAG: hypothetical protein ABI775_04825 [Pseudonocardiales bacterium]